MAKSITRARTVRTSKTPPYKHISYNSEYSRMSLACERMRQSLLHSALSYNQRWALIREVELMQADFAHAWDYLRHQRMYEYKMFKKGERV